MKKWQFMLAAVMAAALLIFAGAALAQDTTSFNDGRINGDIQLGGLAIYCTDQFGNTQNVNTFQNGGINVWSNGGQKIFSLNVNQLRTGTAQNPVLLAEAQGLHGPVWLFRTGTSRFELEGFDEWGKPFSYTWRNCGRGNIQTGLQLSNLINSDMNPVFDINNGVAFNNTAAMQTTNP